LGSADVKAAHRKLMKLTPGVNFTNVLQAAFCAKVQKDADDLNVFLCFMVCAAWDL